MGAIRRNIFLAVVCITGAAILVIEVAATRILAPWYGNTIYTFSSVISVILAALSIGYYTGGRLADKYPSPKHFFAVIAISGFSVYLCQLLAETLLPAIGYRLSIMTGPLVLSVIMFFLPGLLMGMLSPWAIKLQSLNQAGTGIGTISGKVFFWSTLGSILGSLAAGFVLIPSFAVSTIMLATASLLAAIGATGFFLSGGGRIGTLALVIFALALAAGSLAARPSLPPGVLYDSNGIYEHIRIQELTYKGRPARVLQQDRAVSGLLYLDNGESVDYAKYPPLARLVKEDFHRVLTIGGGTYLLPQTLLVNYPDATVDVAEIEPSLYELAQKYFQVLPDPRMRNHITDGRRFLHDSEPFDLIFTDVYYAMTVPAHFSTREYHELVRDRLTSGGVYMANLVGDFNPTSPNILFSQMRVIHEVFPNSYFFATVGINEPGTQSVVVFAVNGDTKLDLDSPEILQHPNPLVRSLPERAIDTAAIDWNRYVAMTDDYAPAEYFGLYTIRRELSAP